MPPAPAGHGGKDTMFINQYLLSFVRGNARHVVLSCCLQLVLTLIGTLISLGTALCVRMIQGAERLLFFTAVWQILLGIAVLLMVRYRLMRVKARMSEHSGIRIKTTLRRQLLDKLFALGPAYMVRRRTGELASIVFNRVEFLTEYYTVYLPNAVSAVLNAGILIAVLGAFNTLTAVVCVVACMGILGCPMLFYFIMRERGVKEMAMHAKYYSDCLDSLQGMTTLKAFNASQRQQEVIEESGERLRRAIMAQLGITMLENVASQFFIGLGSVFAIAIAAWQTSAGHMSGQQLTYTLFFIGACFAPMLGLMNAWHLGYRGVTASFGIHGLLAEPVRHALLPAQEQQAAGQAPPLRGSVRFQNVSFAYQKEEGDVLRDISFVIPEGQSLALVGPSGGGKSTVAQLLAGFYPPGSGDIYIGDELLSEHTVCRMQDHMAAVWQDCHLFYGTIDENIRMGRQDAAAQDIAQAARQAGIHEFIMGLPDGYQTMIGERGMRLSGGERQRIALARAFLRDAPLLILDEATSSLDRENEQLIERSFRQLSQGKTTLVIAHRLATIKGADQIIIIDAGRMIAKGTHNTLLCTSAAYQRLMGSQLQGGQHEA